MANKIKILLLTVVASMAFAIGPATVTAEAANTYCSSGFLSFPAWYSNVTADCAKGEINITQLNDLWIIPLNIVEMLLQAVAYAAVGYLIWGGFKYIKSQGEPSSIQQAKDAIMNSIIGLGVSLASVGIVKFISSSISGAGLNGYGLPKVAANQATLNAALNNVVFPIAGAVAVLFIIIGAYKYVLSNGDAGETKKARNTVLYSVVGLVVIIMSFAIVQLILGRFSG